MCEQPQLHLQFLGKVEIYRGGQVVTGFRSAKAKALLCYLAVTGKSHTRAALAGLLWSDMPEANARRNLSQTLTNLRRLVGPHLTITRQNIAFNRASPYRLDVEAFQDKARPADPASTIDRLQQATTLYQGDFLEGFYVRNAPLFEAWMLGQRSHLRELAMQTLHHLSLHYTNQDELGRAKAIDYATRLLSLEPWWEGAHRQLMLLYAQAGQQAAALRQYNLCCQTLEDELGISPAPETIALYEQIRERKVGPAGTVSLVQPPAFLNTKTELAEFDRPVLVDREGELAQLDSFLKSALADRGQLVFVTGEAGQGKTSLVNEFVRQAQATHASLIVANGYCDAYAGLGDPYLPFRDVMEMLTGGVEAKWAAGAITREHALRLWRLLPITVQDLLNAGPDLIDIFVPGTALVERATTAVPGGTTWLAQLKELTTSRPTGSTDLETELPV